MTGEDRLRELEEKYEGFKIYDNNGGTIGKVGDLFVDEQDREVRVFRPGGLWRRRGRAVRRPGGG